MREAREFMNDTAIASQTRQVRFKVCTADPLPVGEQIFITGSDEALGNWQADGLALTRMEDLIWEAEVALPVDQPLSYKITRGTWEAEEVRKDGTIPKDYVIPSGGDDLIEEHLVYHWNDRRVPQPHIVGDYRVHPQMSSAFLDQDRTVIVWLPPSYANELDRHYPVLYMHDGQQVFDPSTSTWNHDWQVDERCSELIYQKRLQEVVVVAIYSTSDRYAEYNPAERGSDYAKFVIDELKPFIDAEYRTLHDRKHTAVAGSSMGGAISFYLAWTRPDIFFGAACLSSAFLHRQGRFSINMVNRTETLPDLKLYLYCGGGDELEQRLAADLHAMVKTLDAKGFAADRRKIVEDPSGQHNEATWARHTDDWLLYLFANA
jgi:predicted alpha/beta superfamily hydrolase